MDEELKNLINSLSVENFRIVVRDMNKDRYSTPHVRIVDGPYDGGNDLEVMINDTELKKNIQITVQKKKWEEKLQEDLQKAKDNVDNHDYLKKLDFYISQTVTKDKRNKLETAAEVDFNIDLKIIDATLISNDSEVYPSIRDNVYKAHKIDTQKKNLPVKKESKIIFDVLTGNKNTVEIKKNLIYSFVYSYLFTNPDSSLDDIFTSLNESFENTLEKDYLFQEINFLKSKGYIISPKSKDRFDLGEAKHGEIEKIHNNIEIQEHNLIKDIESIITQYKMNCSVTELVEKIYQIYVENYQIDINEIQNTANSFSSSLKKSYNDLEKFVSKNGVTQSDSSNVAKEILKKCSEQEFLNKIATTSLFTNLYNSDKLEEYLNNRVQTVFLDTQILIRLLCIYYREDFKYEDNALIAVKNFYTTIQNNAESVQLVTSMDYIEEVAGHFQEALKLQRFMSLPFIADLGVSKNVFYNAYKRYIEEDIIEEETELIEFIGEILGEDHNVFDDDRNFIFDVTQRLADLYEMAGIEIISHPHYDNYANIKKDYEISLAYAEKNRSWKAREHDLRTILYLSTSTDHVDENTGEVNEPFLLTWDSAFYDFRKTLLGKHKKFTYWYIYSPLKFIDRLSVMNFKIAPSSITHNVVALAETNFNYSTKTNSFFDVISDFFNQEDVSKLSILKKLADLKKETQDLDGKMSEEESILNVKEAPITKVLINIKDHYSSPKDKNSFEDVIRVFEDETFETDIIKILKTALKNFKAKNWTKTTFSDLNNLIEKNA